MTNTILREQLLFKPEVNNESLLRPFKRIVVGGMGGSQICSGLYKRLRPETRIESYRSSFLPFENPLEVQDTFFIASSYSGNTQETLDFAHRVLMRELNLGVLASDGKLLELAKSHNLPYVKLPEDTLPRWAIGYSLLSLSALIGDGSLLERLRSVASTIHNLDDELAHKVVKHIDDHIPLIYVEHKDAIIGYIWKIVLNETGKIPAFTNTLSEVFHNEVESFDEHTRDIFTCVHIHPIETPSEYPKGSMLLEALAEKRGFPLMTVAPQGESIEARLFWVLELVYTIATYVAELRGVDPDNLPTVDWLKTLHV